MQDVLCKSLGKCKAKKKIYNRYTKEKEKGIRAYCYGNSSIYKGRLQESRKEKWNYKNSQKTINKMLLISPYLSIIAQNINGFNSSFKMYTVAGL